MACLTLDSVIAVYDAGGAQIAYNDDSGATDPGSVHGWDSAFATAALAVGTYTVAVGRYPNSSFVSDWSGNETYYADYVLHVGIVPTAQSTGFSAAPQTIEDQDKGGQVTFDLAAALTDTDESETLGPATLAGVPEGVMLSAGWISGAVPGPGPLQEGAEFQVNTYTTNSQFSPSVTALSDGGFVVT